MSSPSRRLWGRLGAVVGAMLAMIIPASCGGSSHPASTAASQKASLPASSATTTSPARPPTGAPGKGTSARPTAATSTGAASSAPAPPPASGGRLLRRFAGDGNGRLGTIVVSAGSLLVWNAHHPGIQIFTSSGFMLVNSHSLTGAVRLSHGTYRGVRVSSAGGWLVELRSPSS